MKDQIIPPTPSLSDTLDIIDVVRKLRNDLIKDFLDERTLMSYLSEQYRILDVSSVKVQFIKRELKQLLITPVDTTRYKPIIEEFNNTGTVSLSEGNERLFYKEIEDVLKRYLYETYE